MKIALQFPEREPDEPDLTDKQLDYIRDLLDDMGGTWLSEGQLLALGRRQASSVIDQLIEYRDRLEDLIEEEDERSAMEGASQAAAKDPGWSGCVWSLIFVGFLIFTVAMLSMTPE